MVKKRIDIRLRMRRICCLSRLITFLSLVLVPLSTAFAQKSAQTSPAEKIIAIRAATLIDGVSAQPRHNVLIVVRGNRIESVSEGGTPPANATVINLPAQV